MAVRWINSKELLWIIQQRRSVLHGLLQKERIPIPNHNGRPLRWTEKSLREWAANPPAGFDAEELTKRINRVCFLQDYYAAQVENQEAQAS